MEQEPASPVLYGTIKRVGYRLMLAVHAVFIIIAFTGAVALLTALLLGS